ncbi:alpha/beta fold hydrolase [Leucobacter sp. NPDC015123]|uniref:alpha/beta fold hydrolase n=1 Tax=Leucobacter sp. NPDC015123 TaxID=3364129 RepID=UPI0036F476D7
MTSHAPHSAFVLVPGHWLGAWAWDEVVAHLQEAGHRATALTLPGLDPADPDRELRNLTDQARAIEAAIREHRGDIVLVAHSGANGPVTAVLDSAPDIVARVVWVDSGPVGDATAFAPDFPEDTAGTASTAGGDGAEHTDALPLPDFAALGKQASLAELSEASLEEFRARALPEPAGVLRERVALRNNARYNVPTTFVCCSLASADVAALGAAGHPMFAEVPRFTDVTYVDLPTGHWPMWSRPRELASILMATLDR